MKYLNSLSEHAKHCTGARGKFTVLPHELPTVLELLRREAALQRIQATGANWQVISSPTCPTLVVWFRAGVEMAFGGNGDPLTADIAEAGQAWAEAQAAPKPAKCPCCGKPCAPNTYMPHVR